MFGMELNTKSKKQMVVKKMIAKKIDLPLNKPLKFHAMTRIIRFVFEEGGKLYPQAFLDDCLYEHKKCMSIILKILTPAY